MLKWVQRKVLREYIKRKIHKEVDIFMNKVIKEVDKGLAKVPGNGKKTLIGALGTSFLALLPIVENLATNPDFHAAVESLIKVFPSWSIYATAGLTGLGLVHKLIKALKG